MDQQRFFQDKALMDRALDLAQTAAGRTSPNPMVGCVIVQDGQIVGEGYHAKAGTPHAEVNALLAAGDQARGSDVYVTLEPCSHYGRTPPCADALVQAGVKRVIIAMADPNPLVSGRGIQKLQDAGIEVRVGLLEDKAIKLNESFLKTITTGLPFVLYKCALTLDGKTAVESGHSQWITSEESRRYVHGLRNSYDVIMIGSQTALQDNPQLTCRGLENGRDPVRLVIDGNLSIPPDARLFSTSESLCIIATTQQADQRKVNLLKEKTNVEVWQYDTQRYLPLPLLMKDIAQRGWNSILLEGGGVLAGKMLEEKLLDKIEFIFAPKLAGAGPSPLAGLHLAKMDQAYPLKDVTVRKLADDYHFIGYLNYSSNFN